MNEKLRNMLTGWTMERLVAVVGVVICVIAGVVILLVQAVSRPSYLAIVNLSEYTDGRPTNDEEVKNLEESLFATVNKYKRIRSNGVKDFRVREGTFEQRDEDDYHLVEFLIDSESLRQSYAVSYQWGNQNKFEQYVGMIVCVQPSRVIYPEFNCKDPIISESLAPERAKLDDYIPYSAEHFEIRSDIRTSPISIIITISINDTETDAVEDHYYNEALRWLMATGLNLDEYTIVRRVLRPNVPNYNIRN
jgi:hypothetical protein